MTHTIVRVLTRLGAGGPPIHAVLLTRQFQKRGFSSLLVTGRVDQADGDMSYLLRPDDPVLFIDELSRAVSPWRDWKALVRLWRLFRTERPAIVHTHTAKAGVLGRLAAHLAGVPVVVHTFHGNVLNHYFPAPVNGAMRWMEWLLAHMTDAICTLSPQQAREMTDVYRVANARKVHIVPLGMDLEPFERLAPAPEGPLVAGWLGRFVAVKDIPLLCRVVRAAPGVRFVIAGDGPQRGLLESLSREVGPDRVHLPGWQRDVSQVIAQCHVLIQTSRNEGTPVALIQGMAAGRPFVATPAGGIVDMVSGSGQRDAFGCDWHDNAVLARPDPDAFAAALDRMSHSSRMVHSMGVAARQFAMAHHTQEAMLDTLDRLYSDLLREKAPRVAMAAARLAP